MSLQEIWQKVIAEITRLFGAVWNYPIPWVSVVKSAVIFGSGFIILLVLCVLTFRFEMSEELTKFVSVVLFGISIAAAWCVGYFIW